MIQVKNLLTNKGNIAKNQFETEIHHKGLNFILMSSYKSNIALYDINSDILYINERYYKYSNTTSKYFNIFVTDLKKRFNNKKVTEKIVNEYEFMKLY